MSGVSETVDYQLRKMFEAVDHPDQYLRINTEMMDAKPDMDDASPENLLALKQTGTACAEKFEEQLERFAQRLIENA